MIGSKELANLKKMQKNEITEYYIYNKIASILKKNDPNRDVLIKVGNDELRHYSNLKEFTNTEIKPNKFKIYYYYFLSLVFGLSFGLRLMESGESIASKVYKNLSRQNRKLMQHSLEEQQHEKKILAILSEERLDYAGSIVLGLNDALIELTGALAGFTFALQNNKKIALVGLITGLAASLSMAASGYLSSKEEADQNELKSPLKAAFYTGIAYVITVILLILPYFLFTNIYISLTFTLLMAISIILFYTFYITTAKGLRFWERFLEMVIITLGVALISFFIGKLLKDAIE